MKNLKTTAFLLLIFCAGWVPSSVQSATVDSAGTGNPGRNGKSYGSTSLTPAQRKAQGHLDNARGYEDAAANVRSTFDGLKQQMAEQAERDRQDRLQEQEERRQQREQERADRLQRQAEERERQAAQVRDTGVTPPLIFRNGAVVSPGYDNGGVLPTIRYGADNKPAEQPQPALAPAHYEVRPDTTGFPPVRIPNDPPYEPPSRLIPLLPDYSDDSEMTTERFTLPTFGETLEQFPGAPARLYEKARQAYEDAVDWAEEKGTEVIRDYKKAERALTLNPLDEILADDPKK